jgi:hypothetical protein
MPCLLLNGNIQIQFSYYLEDVTGPADEHADAVGAVSDVFASRSATIFFNDFAVT